eukprot:scaffold96868_cov79-Phaeocystis_antarctica.AAC.5
MARFVRPRGASDSSRAIMWCERGQMAVGPPSSPTSVSSTTAMSHGVCRYESSEKVGGLWKPSSMCHPFLQPIGSNVRGASPSGGAHGRADGVAVARWPTTDWRKTRPSSDGSRVTAPHCRKPCACTSSAPKSEASSSCSIAASRGANCGRSAGSIGATTSVRK